MNVSKVSLVSNQNFTSNTKVEEKQTNVSQKAKGGKKKLVLALVGLGAAAAAAVGIASAIKKGKFPTSIKYVKGQGIETVKSFTDKKGNKISKKFLNGKIVKEQILKADGTSVKTNYKNGIRDLMAINTKSGRYEQVKFEPGLDGTSHKVSSVSMYSKGDEHFSIERIFDSNTGKKKSAKGIIFRKGENLHGPIVEYKADGKTVASIVHPAGEYLNLDTDIPTDKFLKMYDHQG